MSTCNSRRKRLTRQPTDLGSCCSTFVFSGKRRIAGSAFVELLLDTYEKKGKSDESLQSHFRTSLISTYNSHGLTIGTLWGPVMHQFRNESYRVAAHIIPIHLGHKRIRTTFGPESEKDAFSPRNGLILDPHIERGFDSHLIAVVAILRARRLRRKGWRKASTKDQVWATPGKYIRKSMVPRLV